nr:MAG TPA: hypothetical protein [Caudoviricetes sp.]
MCRRCDLGQIFMLTSSSGMTYTHFINNREDETK